MTPIASSVNGYTSNTNINSDPQFASFPSTASANNKLDQEILVPGAPGQGSDRYVLGPAGLTRSAIAHASVKHEGGQWVIVLSLTPKGSTQWDTLAEEQFHAIVGVVISGQVVSAPITQPTQQSFSSFDGQLQVGGGFTEHQAKGIAAGL